MNLNGVEYYYVRNGQGDIVGLLDSTGTQVVSYTYDSWGKIISIDGSLATTVGIKNPYRYRGYRYDEETKLYYLQSRYYNPEWSRFVNADAIVGKTGELLTHNMFTYTANNQINKSHPTGFWAISIGINYSKAFLVRGSIQISFAFDNSLNNGLFITVGSGSGTPSGGLVLSIAAYPNMKNIKKS